MIKDNCPLLGAFVPFVVNILFMTDIDYQKWWLSLPTTLPETDFDARFLPGRIIATGKLYAENDYFSNRFEGTAFEEYEGYIHFEMREDPEDPFKVITYYSIDPDKSIEDNGVIVEGDWLYVTTVFQHFRWTEWELHMNLQFVNLMVGTAYDKRDRPAVTLKKATRSW